MFLPKPVDRCRGGAPDQVVAWKTQLVEKVLQQGGVRHDILTTQVNTHQLQGMLDTYILHHQSLLVATFDLPEIVA